MRKLYSLVLMATALLIGANAWAEGPVASVTVTTSEGESVTNYETLDLALAAVKNYAALQTLGHVDGNDVVVTLQKEATLGASTLLQTGYPEQRKIILDLNGNDLEMGGNGISLFQAYLNITGEGTISATGIPFWLYGYTETNDNIKSILVIGEKVKVETTNAYAIGISGANNNDATLKHYAYGVTVDIYGYVGGTVYINGNVNVVNENQPHINIHEGATVAANEESAAIYAAGYGFWNIQGTLTGGGGIYAKAGDITLDGAKIIASGEYTEPQAWGNGYYLTGDAIVYDSHSGYTTEGMALTVKGETKVTSENGYAIREVATQGEDKQPDLVIQSGTFEGAEDKGVILTTDAEKNKLQTEGTISGGTFVGDENITEYLGIIEGTVVAVTDEEGNTSYVVENINPSVKSTDLEAAGADNKVVLNSAAENVVTISSDKEVAYLALAGKDKVVVTNGATLKVGNVAIGEEGQIEVMAGSKLVVFGENGVVSNHASNLLLHTEEGNPSYFLLNPAVTANKHPLATVEFISKSFTKSGDNWSKQRFGIPTFGALQSITTKYEGADVQTAIAKYDFSVGDWTDVSWINIDGKDENLDQFANPFEYYQMQHNTPEMGTVVTMVGRLVGNEIPQMNVIAHSWNGYANSLMGTMNIDQVLSIIPNSVQKAIYLNVLNAQKKPEWDARTALNEDTYTDIAPMQAFMIRNELAAAAFNVDYEAAVYNPTIAKAPARYRAANNWTKVQILVSGEEYTDNVIVAEGEEFTADFDNGYEAVKYMNDGINMYVSADEKMAHFATNDLNNTFVGLQTINGGNYTIEFANVQGEELTLIDHETGARVAMVEGATYEFTANGTNDYRFEIVGRANMPTAIDNTEAVKSVKGVYTITGQYVGEMNVWNTLPAGVYVVNGEKRVK